MDLAVWLFLLGGAGSVSPAELPALLEHLQEQPLPRRQLLVERLLSELPGERAPVVTDTLALFLFQGPARAMSIAGDMTAWEPAVPMALVPGTALWYAELALPADARLDYKFVRNGSEWLLDPLNPQTVTGGFGPNSELAMPSYRPPGPPLPADGPPCRIFNHADFDSPQLGNTRTVRVVTPPDFDPQRTHPILLVHDGLEYICLGGLPEVLAGLARAYPDRIWPICVCVPPVNRTAEYQQEQQAAFGRFIVETVMPFVQERYLPPADRRRAWGVLGASNGANIALYLAGLYPEIFDKLLLMSPYVPVAQRDRIAAQTAAHYRIYLNWGRYDLPRLLPLIGEFRALLQQRQIAHLAREYNQGHSWGLWRATLGEGLLYLYDEKSPPRRP